MSEEKPKRQCKEICKQYRAERPNNGNRYSNGQVRCQICEIYMTKEGCKDKQGNQATEDTKDLFCKCCNYRVRSKPRNRIYKEKYQEQIDKNNENDSAPMDIEELKNFITAEARPQANYQFVIIKTLLENNFTTTKNILVDALKFYNKDIEIYDNGRTVFSVLEERNIITKSDDGNYSINLDYSVSYFDILETVSLCNQKIYENKIKTNPDYFIALGPWENWNHTIEHQPLRWGVADSTPTNTAIYDLASEGDIVFYYSTKHEPIYFTESGFFGIGIIRKKEINKEEKYWPEERKTNRAYFTHKIYLDTIKFAQSDTDLVPISTGLPLVKGFNHITEGPALNELIKNTQTKWNVLLQNKSESSVNYWKIAPGPQASDWKIQKALGLVAIGWNELGDLDGKSFESIHQKLRELWPSAIGNTSSQFRDFLSIKKGDIIIANKGKSHIVGIGRVIGDYQYQPALKYMHTYPVEWLDTNEYEIPDQPSWFITVNAVSEEDYKQIMSNKISSVMSTDEFETLIKRFNQDRTIFNQPWHWPYYSDHEKIEQRKEFITKFPSNEIQNITIEDYALGLDDEDGDKNRSNFSYMLEQKTRTFGHIGGTARKFGLFYKRDEGKFWHHPSYQNKEEAFSAILEQIQRIVNAGRIFVENHNVQQLSNVIDDTSNFIIHRQIRSKILAVYFPNTFLGITSMKHINNLLNYFKIPQKELGDNLTQKQFKLIEIKKAHPIMKNWSVEDYSYFLWNTLCAKPGQSNDTDEDTEENTDTDENTTINESQDEILESFDDVSLRKITSKEMEEGVNKILEDLIVDPDTIRDIVINLASGRHIILAGPVGTGKTELARKIPRVFWTESGGYYAEEHTATADWNTTDVIGGIMPKMVGKNPSYEVQLGCVSETVLKNWESENSIKRVSRMRENKSSHGTWLIIDEFNRADIDKAFGQLFTSLESRQLKVPDTNKRGYSEFIIPKDYRIIGTLNTADKHYLFHLSDALKRRFAYVEVNSPERKDKDHEIYYAIKNAILQLPKDDYSSLIVLDDSLDKKIINKEKSNKEFVRVVEKAYDVLDFVRMSKPLGTAILKSIYQTMLVAASMSNNFDKVLDFGLRTNLIPQLENISSTNIETIIAVFYTIPVDFFKKIQDDSSNKEKYKDDFANLLSYMRLSQGHQEQIIQQFVKGQIKKEGWDDLQKRFEDHQPLKEELFKKSLQSLLKTSTMI
ncbi:AAA family ATPase [Nitrosarchaeum koreense]|uniref:ATPase associated with various cellular activities AAA 5 n=1 Tax=Nitrosarchaeum koreense MY1 TaxID=1001994 RepID=F9CXT6_9ARCH|nr:AAA family ATPase [Nitrosarchaeum koreense]EGP94052.1 ATPase associated with various cellular activities AAA 5 [Nitrosarchaeum koreense MY1]